MKRKTTALLIILIIFTGLLTLLSSLLSNVVEPAQGDQGGVLPTVPDLIDFALLLNEYA